MFFFPKGSNGPWWTWLQPTIPMDRWSWLHQTCGFKQQNLGLITAKFMSAMLCLFGNIKLVTWLPGDWNMFFSIFCMGMENNPKWRTQSMIFQRGSFTKNHQAASLCQMDEWMVRGIFFGMVNVNPGWTNSPSLSIGIRLVDWCLTFFQIGQVGDIRWPSLKTDLLSQYAWKMVGYDIAVPYITLTV